MPQSPIQKMRVALSAHTFRDEGGTNGIVEALSYIKTLINVNFDAAHKRRRRIVRSEAATVKLDSNAPMSKAALWPSSLLKRPFSNYCTSIDSRSISEALLSRFG